MGTGQPTLLRFFRTLFIVILLLAGIVRYIFFSEDGGISHPKPVALTVSKHSGAFNESLQKVLDAYYILTDAFAASDTAAINKNVAGLQTALSNFKVEELKKDSLIYLSVLDPLGNIKAETESILKDPSIEEKRGSLNILSDNLRNLLVTVKYDVSKVYWQECAEAFGEERPGNWLSKTADVKNPYPLKDNKECGAPKDTLNYMPVDSTKK